MLFLSRRLVGILLLAGGVALPAVPVLGSLRTANQVIVTADDVVREDLYRRGRRTIVEGVRARRPDRAEPARSSSRDRGGRHRRLVGGPVRLGGEVGSRCWSPRLLGDGGPRRSRRERLRGEARVGARWGATSW